MIHLSSDERNGISFAIAVNERRQLVACSFSDRNREEAMKAVREAIGSSALTIEDGNAANKAIFQGLHDLFQGRSISSMNSVDLPHVSGFRREVYLLLQHIPRGRVTTYGAIARKFGPRGYSRAVGTAVGSNPMSLIVPCHRVVPASLEVGNYGMPGRKPSEGGYVKRGLLEREGVKFLRNKISRESVWSP